MAKSTQAFTYENGFQEIAKGTPWAVELSEEDGEETYVSPPWKEIVTSEGHNDFGINLLRTWPTIYDGTNDPHGIPDWWNPSNEVDVLICGDKAEGPLIAGRADGVQPRFLEILNSWGLAHEVHEEGPLIERTAIYKDGKKLFFNRSHQSDSRYRGLHIITQGQIERIYIRDLLRHRKLVERSSTLSKFSVENDGSTHPVRATIQNERTGKEEEVRAKFLVGSDGGSSKIRKGLSIPFDGISTDIYWGIMDCIYETDYPHAWNFGSVINSKYGGCVIIPREDGYIRLYTQLDVSFTGVIAASRQAKDPTFSETGGKVNIHTITPEEVLEQTNRVFSPYKVKFGAPLSWFTIWKISERVARNFSSPDQRVHLVGDAAHVHSVMGAFGLNASIMDASNLAWKLGLVSKGKADVDTLMPTYNHERREQACRIIEVSGEYLRFVCNTSLPIVDLRNPEKGIMLMTDGSTAPAANGASEKDTKEPTNGTKETTTNGAPVTNGINTTNGTTTTNGTETTNGVSAENGAKLNGDAKTNGSAKASVSDIRLDDASFVNGQIQKKNLTEFKVKDVDEILTPEILKKLATFVGRSDTTQLGVDIPFADERTEEDPNALDLKFLGSFFGRNGQFLLGVEAPFDPSVITTSIEADHKALKLRRGVRAPNPRVAYAIDETGYLYDKMKGAGRFHLLIFASNLRGKARGRVTSFAANVLGNKDSFYHKNGGSDLFNIVLVISALPDEGVGLTDSPELEVLRKTATVVYDDRAPDENAHTAYGVDHTSGGLVVVRPDLWVGTTTLPDGIDALESYFGGFLVQQKISS